MMSKIEGAVCSLLLLVLLSTVCDCYHDTANVRYHCWPLDASTTNIETIPCGGLSLDWPQEPPDTVERGQTFNVSYTVTATDVFYTGATTAYPNENTTYVNQLCGRNGTCPAESSSVKQENCCIWHANVHTCHPSVREKNIVCGPWVSDDGLLSTHTDAQYGTIGDLFFAQNVRINFEGSNFIIVHVKLGNMQIALGKEVFVKATENQSNGASIETLVGTILGVAFLLLAVLLVVSLIVVLGVRRKSGGRNVSVNLPPGQLDANVVSFSRTMDGNEYIDMKPEDGQFRMCTLKVQSSFRLNLPPNLLIKSSGMRLIEPIGQGEFGIVYKGHLVKVLDPETVTDVVAVKTLKGFHDKVVVRNLLKECAKMKEFDHPNVLRLVGVCMDGGPAPYIVMPFMCNGSLLSYLKKDRDNLVLPVSKETSPNEVGDVQKRLMEMCIQVAKGMEYLASKNHVHRDLAARNCMIDVHFNIKVADFGLSESTGTKNYFRQDKEESVKLPVKWLAPECLTDCVFSEKSDVWAYGITCWEIFTGGRTPYPTLLPTTLLNELESGYRLEKPLNAACSDEMYAAMLGCWAADPSHRPTFSSLVESLSTYMHSMADVESYILMQSVTVSDATYKTREE